MVLVLWGCQELKAVNDQLTETVNVKTQLSNSLAEAHVRR